MAVVDDDNTVFFWPIIVKNNIFISCSDVRSTIFNRSTCILDVGAVMSSAQKANIFSQGLHGAYGGRKTSLTYYVWICFFAEAVSDDSCEMNIRQRPFSSEQMLNETLSVILYVLTTVWLTDQSQWVRPGLSYSCVHVLSHREQMCGAQPREHLMFSRSTSCHSTTHHYSHGRQMSRSKTPPPAKTSESLTGPGCRRVQRDHIRKNAVMFAAGSFNGGTQSQKTQLVSKAGGDPAKC